MRRAFLIALLASLGLAGAFGVGVSVAPRSARAENFLNTSKSGVPGVAGVMGSGDFIDNQRALFRSAIAVADTRTTAGILATQEFILKGRQCLLISPRFSASGATATIRVYYVNKFDANNNPTDVGSPTNTTYNKIKGYSDFYSITAPTSTDEGTYNAGDIAVDGAGAMAIRVLVTTAPSSGTLTLWVGSK